MESTVSEQTAYTTPPAPATEMSVKDWFITILIASLPVIGFIMLFVWAFGNDQKVSRANWAKATLLWMVVVIGFFVVIGMLIGTAGLIGALTGQN